MPSLTQEQEEKLYKRAVITKNWRILVPYVNLLTKFHLHQFDPESKIKIIIAHLAGTHRYCGDSIRGCLSLQKEIDGIIKKNFDATHENLPLFS